MPQVHVFARIQPRPEDRPEVLAALQTLVPQTRAEAGCRRFELNTGIDGDGALYLVEIWDSAADLTAHHALPHTIAAAKVIEGKLLAETEVVRMSASS